MATTRTLPVSGGVITKPALTDTADISVISTDMENIYQEFVSQNNNLTNVENAHFGVIGSTSNYLTNLDDIPNNSMGRVHMAPSISYVSANTIASYVCFGTAAYKTLICSSQSVGNLYVNTKNGGNDWVGWKRVTLENP